MAPKVKTPAADISVETSKKTGTTKVTVDPTEDLQAVPTSVGEALGNALNVTKGTNVLDKVFPLVVAIAYVAAVILSMFGVLPSTPEAMAGMTTLAGIGGFYLRAAGSNGHN